MARIGLLSIPCPYRLDATTCCTSGWSSLRGCYTASTRATSARCIARASRRGGCAKFFRCSSWMPDMARRLGRRLRKVTRRLGAVRELDVSCLLIDELQETGRYDSQAAPAAGRGHRGGACARARSAVRQAADRRAASHCRQARQGGVRLEDAPFVSRLAVGRRGARRRAAPRR